MHKHLIKILGLAVLAVVGVMAVSASAAQANYALLLNLNVVPTLHVGIEVLPGELTLKNNLKIHCEGGTGLGIVKELNKGATLDGEAHVTFEGCEWLGASEQCEIENETILASGTGEAYMDSETGNYYIEAESEEFATVVTLDKGGCPLPVEEEEVVHGSATVLIGTAGEVEGMNKTFSGEIGTNQELFLGAEEVESLTGEWHVFDFLDPAAYIGAHLT